MLPVAALFALLSLNIIQCTAASACRRMRSSEQGRRWRACAEPPGPPAVPCSPSGSRRQLPAKPRPAQAAYAAANWPLAHAALSADGADVAVAGARGLALYSRRSGRWRLFGDVSQERELAVAHLLWLPRVVAVCAATAAAPRCCCTRACTWTARRCLRATRSRRRAAPRLPPADCPPPAPRQGGGPGPRARPWPAQLLCHFSFDGAMAATRGVGLCSS